MSKTTDTANGSLSEKKNPSAVETSSFEEKGTTRHIDKVEIDAHALNVKLANPLAGIPHDELVADAERFAIEHNMAHLVDEFRKGALVAQDPTAFESLDQLSEEDKNVFRRELTNRWDQPKTLYYLVSSSICFQVTYMELTNSSSTFGRLFFALLQLACKEYVFNALLVISPLTILLDGRSCYQRSKPLLR